MNSTQATVFIVDDDSAVRYSLELLVKSVGLRAEAFPTARHFLDRITVDDAGCLVLDIRMPAMSGLELQQVLKDIGVMLPIVFITGHGDVAMAVQALREGALDFVEKPFNDQDLLDRINQALALDQQNRIEAAKFAALQTRFSKLSARESEVLQRVVAGQANKVIAVELGLSERTIEIHRAKVMSKTGAKSFAELVTMAMRFMRGPELSRYLAEDT